MIKQIQEVQGMQARLHLGKQRAALRGHVPAWALHLVLTGGSWPEGCGAVSCQRSAAWLQGGKASWNNPLPVSVLPEALTRSHLPAPGVAVIVHLL